MKKNSKGFTLVELLASIVILGILSVFALPVITRTVDDSRSKMYISDAKKLISQAEYQMKASSSTIAKPDSGKCIVISLAYLDTTAIATGPNGGEYDTSSSFVVVKNNSGKLEYSAMLVEHMKKGGYRGVGLSKESVLRSNFRTARNRIQNFSESQLIDVETGLTTAYINHSSRLGSNYVSAISKVYHYQELTDPSITSMSNYTPIIKSVELQSTANDNFGALTANLVLKVNDSDTPRNQLTVYYSNVSFDDVNAKHYEYGNNVISTHLINFGTDFGYSYTNGATFTLYVTVKDPQGNGVTRALDYTIHKNTAPVIQYVTVTGVNNTTSPFDINLNFAVYDDVDATSSLKICYSENISSDSCSSYKNYNANGKDSYRFTCPGVSGGCKRDGTLHSVKIFLKDTKGLWTSKTVTYSFPMNTKPKFDGDISVVSKEEVFTTTGSKTVTVTAKAVDDLAVDSNLKFYISDGSGDPKEYAYSSTNKYTYTISGNYDGSERTISVYIVDKEGARSDETKTATYTLYKNKAPEITSLTLNSDGYPCTRENLCSAANDGGSKSTKIRVVAKDDLDAKNKLKICVSENRSYCNTASNFVSYENYNQKEVSLNLTGNYDGSIKTVYVVLKDTYNEISEATATYQLYNDKLPVSGGAVRVVAADNPYKLPLLDIYYYPNMIDDIDSSLIYQICYKITSESETCNAAVSSVGGHFHLKESDFVGFSGKYEGQDLEIYAKVKDSAHTDLVMTNSIHYTLYQNGSPEIMSIKILYQDDLTAKVSFVVKDYLDQYKVGISVDGTCDNVEYPDVLYDGSNLASHVVSYQYTDSVAETTLCVKDKDNHVVSQKVTPVLENSYETCSSMDPSTVRYSYVTVAGQESISKSRCKSMCYANNPVTGEENMVRGYYKRTLTYFDQFNSTTSCPLTAENYTANCSFKDCFYNETDQLYYQAIGLVLYEDDAPWTVQFAGSTYVCNSHYKLYESSYTDGDESITLTEIENSKVCPALVSNEDYMANYVRVADQFAG